MKSHLVAATMTSTLAIALALACGASNSRGAIKSPIDGAHGSVSHARGAGALAYIALCVS